jgi:hypothetical protein
VSPIKWASEREPFVSTNMPCLTALKTGFVSLQNTVNSAGELPTVLVWKSQKKSEYSRRFGEPAPAFVITLVVALLTIALRRVVAEADGLACL